MNKMDQVVVLISADIEWNAIKAIVGNVDNQHSPLGDWFYYPLKVWEKEKKVIFFHGGWGKIAAAASTQYVIDRWSPALLINLGTCGGFEGEIERGTILLVVKTIVYDIVEQMGDYEEHIAHYTTYLDLSWLGNRYPIEVRKSLLVSGDRDLLIEDIPRLMFEYGAIAGDWESGAIAFVAANNHVRLLILRGVTDLVGSGGGEAYGNIEIFEKATRGIMIKLVQSLPGWIENVAKHL